MKRIAMNFIILSLMAMVALFGCKKDDPAVPEPTADTKIRITAGTRAFTATLHDNATAATFKILLPMTVTMSELNSNEKYYGLPQSLPTSASNPGRIQNGDLMLYGSNTLVLFYKSFNTSYSYTRIGRIHDASGLQSALGSGSVTVTFELM